MYKECFWKSWESTKMEIEAREITVKSLNLKLFYLVWLGCILWLTVIVKFSSLTCVDGVFGLIVKSGVTFDFSLHLFSEYWCWRYKQMQVWTEHRSENEKQVQEHFALWAFFHSECKSNLHFVIFTLATISQTVMLFFNSLLIQIKKYVLVHLYIYILIAFLKYLWSQKAICCAIFAFNC